MFNFERGNVVSDGKVKRQKTSNELQNVNNAIDQLVSKAIQKIGINKELTEDEFYQLVSSTIIGILNCMQDTSKKQILEQLQKQIDKKEGDLLKTTFEIFSRKANGQQLNIQKLQQLPISILNELNLDSTRLQILPNNTLQNLSVKHLEKLPIEKLITLNIEEEKLKLLSPKTLQNLISTKTQKLKGNIELKGNEGYLMINGEFIKADEFLSGFEFEKDSFKPIDPQIANEVQKIMYGDITVNNLDNPKLETNLSHSEQRMMLYILQKLEEQKQKQKRGEEIKEEDKIKEIVMFTGRKCCPVCHEALPKFMEHIKNKYGDLVPKTMTVYDFWNNDYNNMLTLHNNNTYKETYWIKNTDKKEGLIQNEFYRNIKSYEDLIKDKDKDEDKKETMKQFINNITDKEKQQKENITIYFNAPFECYDKEKSVKIIIYTPHSEETYRYMLDECKYKIATIKTTIKEENVPIAEPYYIYRNSDLINYKSVFDGKVDTQHLSKFVNKINNHRCIGTNNTIGNPQYTVESLKGDSNVPIVFSVEELSEEGIIDETTQKDIKTLQQNLQIIISKLRENEKQLKELELKLENAKKTHTTQQTKQRETFTTKSLQKQTVTTILPTETKNLIEENSQLLKQLNKQQKQYYNIKQKIVENLSKKKKEEIIQILSNRNKKLNEGEIRLKQNEIAIKTLKQSKTDLQNYLNKTFALGGIMTSGTNINLTINSCNNSIANINQIKSSNPELFK